jgi:hypothetical protein
MKIDIDNKAVQDTYDEVMLTVDKLLGNNTNPLAIAGVLLAQALQIYKTALPPEDFNAIVDHIPETKDNVKPWNGPNIH